LVGRAGVNINAANQYGSTPLHAACLRSHIAVALSLLESGAERESRNAGGRTPLFDAVMGLQHRLIEPEMGEIGESRPFDVNAVASDGTTRWIAAVGRASFDIVYTLLSAGADQRISRRSETALMIAEWKGMTSGCCPLSMSPCFTEAARPRGQLRCVWRSPPALWAAVARVDV
jgi:ankyrin repeat protein